MKAMTTLILISLFLYTLSSQAFSFTSEHASPADSAHSAHSVAPSQNDAAHNDWLKKRFNQQHQELIPVVAVADMFLICNQTRKVEETNYQLKYLITEMDKNVLAEKLSNCLGNDNVKSNVALNFGLFGCFQAQLAHLPKADRQQKMDLVKQAIASLSLTEREKSFTQCVTEQSIHYLK